MPRRRSTLPPDVLAIYAQLAEFYEHKDDQGRTWCNALCGVYAFFDYDGEPIYVGQTVEQLRKRIGRHLTNQRTDAVAMNVLDPLEVAEIEVWPFWELEGAGPGYGAARVLDKSAARQTIAAAEFTVYQQVKQQSPIGAARGPWYHQGPPRRTRLPHWRGRPVPTWTTERDAP